MRECKSGLFVRMNQCLICDLSPCPVDQLITFVMDDVQTCILDGPNTAILPVNYNNWAAEQPMQHTLA